jgi:hypothetical protein
MLSRHYCGVLVATGTLHPMLLRGHVAHTQLLLALTVVTG